VEVAETLATVGLVCGYAIDGNHVLWDGLPYARAVSPGKEFCRWALLGGAYVLGSATSQMIRSDLVRQRVPFYDAANLHADYEACFELLQQSDFGFVHQVLSYSRPRTGSMNDRAAELYSHMLGTLTVLLHHGSWCLSEEELANRLKQRWKQYYRMLAENVFRFREREFWQYHSERLAALGCSIDKSLIAREMMAVALERSLQPKDSIKALLSFGRKDRKASSAGSDHAIRQLHPIA
jgi:hypothetical protein